MQGSNAVYRVPTEIWQNIFASVGYEDRRLSLPLVCHQWHMICQHTPALWRKIRVEPPFSCPHQKLDRQLLLTWLTTRASGIRQLHVRMLDFLGSHNIREGDLQVLLQPLEPHLEELTLQRSCLVLSPADFSAIGALRQLRSLKVQSFMDMGPALLGEGMQWLGALQQLTSLTLEMGALGFPEAVCQLSRLRHLHLQRFQVEVLPAAVSRLTCLTALELVECQVRAVPVELCRLTSLEVLHLGLNLLGQRHVADIEDPPPPPLPDAMSRLTRLRRLSLACCQLEGLPPLLAHLPHLAHLHLAGSRPLNTFPPEAFLPASPLPSAYVALSALNLASCSLARLPVAITCMRSLRQLEAACNQLASLPGGLTVLTALQQVDLHRNHLGRVPAPLAHMTALVAINLADNPIRYDATACHVAALPLLGALKLPTPVDPIAWQAGGFTAPQWDFFAEALTILHTKGAAAVGSSTSGSRSR